MFCARCGNELPAAAKFCPKCGQAAGTAPQPAKTFTITVTRAKQFNLVDPMFKVTVDAQAEYFLKDETLCFPISAGTHELVVSFGFYKTFLKVHVAGNMTLTVKWNRLTDDIEVK